MHAVQPAGATLVISGRAVETSVANDPDELFEALISGQSGLGPLRHPDVANLRTILGYEVPGSADTEQFMRASGWVTTLIRKALDDADATAFDPKRLVVVIGTSQREQNSVELWATGRARAIRSDELSYRSAVVDAVGAVRIISLLGACAAGLVAVGVAADLLDDDEADMVIVVSVDPLQSTATAMYDRVSVEKAERIQPFNSHRKGTIFGEGAAVIVLERAGAREVMPKVVLRGVGLSSDGHNSTAPDVRGLLAAMSDAHLRAGVAGEDIDVVVSHGTGTSRNDDTEADALMQLQCTNAFVTSIKPMLGHTLGSSGLLNLIVAAACLERGSVPAVLHLTEKTSSAAQLTVPAESVEGASLRFAQVDAFGFGGINAVAVLELVG